MVRKKNTTPLDTMPMVSDFKTRSNTMWVRARNIPGESNIKRAKVLRIGSWNVGSMNQKSYQLEEVMLRRKIDILCVQETKWKNLGNKSRFWIQERKTLKYIITV